MKQKVKFTCDCYCGNTLNGVPIKRQKDEVAELDHDVAIKALDTKCAMLASKDDVIGKPDTIADCQDNGQGEDEKPFDLMALTRKDLEVNATALGIKNLNQFRNKESLVEAIIAKQTEVADNGNQGNGDEQNQGNDQGGNDGQDNGQGEDQGNDQGGSNSQE